MDLVFKQVYERTRGFYTATVHYHESAGNSLTTINYKGGMIRQRFSNDEIESVIQTADYELKVYVAEIPTNNIALFLDRTKLSVPHYMVQRWLGQRDGFRDESDEDAKADLLKWLEAN